MTADPSSTRDLLRSYESDPLALARRSSGRLKRNWSTASDEAADNLLKKALARLDGGDVEAARRFVQRALDLPFDDFEQRRPGPWALHMRLFICIYDDLMSCAEGDHSWLRRAETLIDQSSPAAGIEIRRCLRNLFGSLAELSPKETKRVQQLTVGIQMDEDPLADIAERTAQVDAVIDVLRAISEVQLGIAGPPRR